MKKIFTLTFLLVGFVLNNQGQVTLKYNNQAIIPGTSHHFKLANKADVGPAGPNQVWNFSDLKAEGDLTSYMLDAKQTPKGNLIPEANAVIQEGSNLFYFAVSKNIIEEYGLASGNAVYRYDKPLVKMKFPFRYGDKYEGQFHGTDVNNQSVQLNGTFKIEVDAYGTLMLPNATIKNVIRLKSTRTDGTGNLTNSTVTYRWYSTDVRYPLLTIITYVSGSQTNSAITAYYADASNAKSSPEKEELAANDIKLSVYPNPYSEKFNIEYNLFKQSNVNISIVDNNGKTICTLVDQIQDAGQYSKIFNATDYGVKQGIYFVRVMVGSEVNTLKMVKVN